jgi:hypothetical protein
LILFACTALHCTARIQMMNTIEYRVDCQLLQHLHFENNLGCRCVAWRESAWMTLSVQ